MNPYFLELEHTIWNSTQDDLRGLIGKKISSINASSLTLQVGRKEKSCHFHTPCQVRFVERGYVHLLRIKPFLLNHPLFEAINGLNLKVIREKIPKYEGMQKTIEFHRPYHVIGSNLTFNLSPIQEIIIYGYEHEGPLQKEDFSTETLESLEVIPERYYIRSIEGIIFRLESGKELIFQVVMDRELYLNIYEKVQPDYPFHPNYNMGWKSKIHYHIK